jgi:hypothetical protein
MCYFWLVRLYVSMGTSLIDVWCLKLVIGTSLIHVWCIKLVIYLFMLVLKMHCDDCYFSVYKIFGDSGTYVRILCNLWRVRT